MGEYLSTQTPTGNGDKDSKVLMEIARFVEEVSTKIHGLGQESLILDTLREEFQKSKKYNLSVFLVSGDGRKLEMVVASLGSGIMQTLERISGMRADRVKIEVDGPEVFRQVVREGKTVALGSRELVGQLVPGPASGFLLKTVGYEDRKSIATPLRRREEIIGVLVLSAPGLAERFAPSVESFARHVSTALQLADEESQRETLTKQTGPDGERILPEN
jgi:GAF domain-containing protein